MTAKLTERGSALVMALIRKEISLPEAQAKLSRAPAPPCHAGRYGVCITHGQPIEECEE